MESYNDFVNSILETHFQSIEGFNLPAAAAD